MGCHACQREAELAVGESVGFRAECEGCGADLHVCLNCAHHDPTAYNDCRESSAERVHARDRANRCDYFRPGTDELPGAEASGRDQALQDLEALFKKS